MIEIKWEELSVSDDSAGHIAGNARNHSFYRARADFFKGGRVLHVNI